MKADEIFANRRVVAKNFCISIRENNGRLTKAKFFPERPYSGGERSYKFSSANYLRLLASDNDIIRKCAPRWVSVNEIKNNGWSLRENAKPELLEVWSKSADDVQECFLSEFYNESDIVEKDSFTVENQSLENIIAFFQARGLIEQNADVISFQDCIDAVKQYAEEQGADELTAILSVQSWVAESKLKTKKTLFLPTYPDFVLVKIEQAPDKLFESMNKARVILKKLRREKEMAIEETVSADSAFCDLKIIYHGSETELESTDGTMYFSESVLTSAKAYKFLFEFKAKTAKENFKTWLEFSYKGYEHGKFLLSDKIPQNESITTFLRTRLDKNRQHLLQNPQDLRLYIATVKVIRADELLHQISLESKFFQSVMDEFEQEESSYLSSYPELLQM